jgi:hypothetical protein
VGNRVEASGQQGPDDVQRTCNGKEELVAENSAPGKVAPPAPRLNLFERRALRRAATRLPLVEDELPLEFDIGQSAYSRLPGFTETDFSRWKRIDLVATDRALYAHCGGRIVRYAYADILNCWLGGAVQLRGNFLYWRCKDGLKAQVYVGAQRPLARFLGDQVARLEAKLGSHELDECNRLRTKYTEQDEYRARLEKALYPRPYVSIEGFEATMRSVDSQWTVSGWIRLDLKGAAFWGDDAEVVVPYCAISKVQVDTDHHLIAELEERPVALFKVRSRNPLDSEWSEKRAAEVERSWRSADASDVIVMYASSTPPACGRFASFEVQARGTASISEWARQLEEFKTAAVNAAGHEGADRRDG